MRIKCSNCSNYISDTDEKCYLCGNPNKDYKRVIPDAPTTIDELKSWYDNQGLPPEDVTRFFIGKNIKEEKAFGIYYDDITQNYVVYKNKADGSRAIRYEGPNEDFAVAELYLRLKDEIKNQKSRKKGLFGKRTYNKASEAKGKRFLKISIIYVFLILCSFFVIHFYGFPTFGIFFLLLFCFFLFLFRGFFVFNKNIRYSRLLGIIYFIMSLYSLGLMITTICIDHFASSNYYYYNNNYYYRYNYDWYKYNNGWHRTYKRFDEKDYNKYVIYYNDDYNMTCFEDTDYYEFYRFARSSSLASAGSHNGSSSGSHNDRNNNDHDSSWSSSDSWDSGSTDWDSDW